MIKKANNCSQDHLIYYEPNAASINKRKGN